MSQPDSSPSSLESPSSTPFSSTLPSTGPSDPRDVSDLRTDLALKPTLREISDLTRGLNIKAPSLLPRFLNYRELYTFLYSNKGVDLEPVKNLLKSVNNDALVELIAFILDRPIAPDEKLHLYAPSGPLFGKPTFSSETTNSPDTAATQMTETTPPRTVVKFGADHFNIPLSELQQNVLLPGHRNQEREVVDYLGLNHGCRQQCRDTFILANYLYDELANISIQRLYQWDIMRVIRSRDWMDELYLGSAFRKAVQESPFRRMVEETSRLVNLNAISVVLFRRICTAELLKLTFGPAKDPKYQDHLNLWLGTHFGRPLQSIHSIFGITQLRQYIQDYSHYVDYVDRIVGALSDICLSIADVKMFDCLFNQRIPLIPLFDNHHEAYVHRERDHSDSDSYDALLEEFQPGSEATEGRCVLDEGDVDHAGVTKFDAYHNSPAFKNIKQMKKWPHCCSLNVSPITRRRVHRFNQYPFNRMYTYISRISQLKSDIAQFDTKCENIDGVRKIFSPATMIPMHLTFDELHLVLQFYQSVTLKVKEFVFFVWETTGVNYAQPSLIQQFYTIARLYDDHEVMQMLTKLSGIDNDNMWTYCYKDRLPHQTQPHTFCFDGFYYPLAATPQYPKPFTQIAVQPGDPYSYHDDPEDVKAKYDAEQQHNPYVTPISASIAKPFVYVQGKKKTQITPADRVEKSFMHRYTPAQILRNVFYDALCYDLDRIVALWDTTSDYYHKRSPLSSDFATTRHDPITTSSTLDDICGLDPEHIKFSHDISFATKELDFSIFPLTEASPMSTLQAAFFSRTVQLTLFKFLLSQHHGRIVTVLSDKSAWYSPYINPYEIYRYPNNPHNSYGYSFDPIEQHMTKAKSDLAALPKIQDPDDVVIIGSPADSDSQLEHQLQDDQQPEKNTIKKSRLTLLEFQQYTRLSQESINITRQTELTRVMSAPLPELELFFIAKLLIQHTKRNKSLFSPTIHLSQRVVDEINEKEAAKASKSDKRAVSKSSSTTTTTTTTTTTATQQPSKAPLLPRITKAKVNNLWFWPKILHQILICFENASLFGSHKYRTWVEILKSVIENEMLTLHLLTASGRKTLSLDSSETVEPSAIERTGILYGLATLFETARCHVLMSDRKRIGEFDTLTIELLDYLFNNQIGRSFIRNGMSTLHDFALDLSRPAKAKSPMPNAAATTGEPKHNRPSRASLRNTFHTFHLNSLFDFITTLPNHSPIVAQWMISTFGVDIAAALLGGDDAASPFPLPFTQTPTELVHGTISGGKKPLNATTTTTKLAENSAETAPFQFTWDFFLEYMNLFRFIKSWCLDAYRIPLFMLSDFPYLPPMADLLPIADMELAPPTVLRLGKALKDAPEDEPDRFMVLPCPADGLEFPDYIPMSEFNHNIARHIRGFLPHHAQNDQTVVNSLFPFQQFNFLLASSPHFSPPSWTATPATSSTVAALQDQSIPIYTQSNEPSSTNSPLFFFPHFQSVISEKWMPPRLENSLRTGIKLRSMNPELFTNALEHIEQFFPPNSATDALSFALIEPKRFPVALSGYIEDIDEQFTSSDLGLEPYSLGPLFPWNMHPTIFNLSGPRSALERGTNDATKSDVFNHTAGGHSIQIELLPNHVPIARYPHLLSSDRQVHVSQAYLPQLSCVGYDLSELTDGRCYSTRHPSQTRQELQPLPTSVYNTADANSYIVNFGLNHENSSSLTYNAATYQRVRNNAMIRQFNAMHRDLMKKLRNHTNDDDDDDDDTLTQAGATRITTTLQAGVSPVPKGLDPKHQDIYAHHICFHFSPLSDRLAKYFDRLVALNRQAGYSACRHLTAFDILSQIIALLAPFFSYAFFLAAFPSLQAALQNHIAAMNPPAENDEHAATSATPPPPSSQTLLDSLYSTLSDSLSLTPTQIRNAWVVHMFGDSEFTHPHFTHHSPVLHHLSSFIQPLVPPAAAIAYNSEMLECLATLTNPMLTKRLDPQPSQTFNADLSYMSSLSQEFLNCVGVFEPTEVQAIFAKYFAYMTTTTKTSHYRDGRGFASTNYIKFKAGLPILAGPRSSDGIHGSSVTWEYAKLRQEYLAFMFHQYDQKEALPTPFSNHRYQNDSNHIVNRYNRFVESELCSTPRDVFTSPTPRNKTSADGYDVMYGTRLVFDFEQFLHNPSLGSISYVPNISTKADPTTATAVMMQKYPLKNEQDPTRFREIDPAQFLRDTTSFTATYDATYILNPAEYNPSPITTPLYNRREDNILNLPQQFYHTISNHINLVQANYLHDSRQNPSSGECYLLGQDGSGLPDYLKYLGQFRVPDLRPSPLSLHHCPAHRFMSTRPLETDNDFQTYELFPQFCRVRTTSHATSTLLAELYILAQKYPILLQSFEHYVKCMQTANKLPLPPASSHPLMTRSIRHLALVLQQFTSQPFSPLVFLRTALHLLTTSTLMNLMDLMLWKTNGDFFHSIISRSFYLLANSTSVSNAHLFANYKLHPADYFYYFSPIWSVFATRYQIDNPEQFIPMSFLAMKYNITREFAIKQVSDLVSTYIYAPLCGPQTNPHHTPREELTKYDFYQSHEDFNHFDHVPNPPSLISTVLSHLNPATSKGARAALTAVVATSVWMVWDYYSKSTKKQSKEGDDGVTNDH